MKEFTSVDALMAHYRDVLSRRPPPEPKPKRIVIVAPEPAPPDPPPAPLPPPLPPLTAGPVRTLAVIVSNYYGLTIADLRDPSHVPTLVRPRQVFCYVCRHIAKQSYPRIGRLINRDHSTIVHACNKIEELIKTDEALATDVGLIASRYRKRRQARYMEIIT
jgi:hypothetical protein